MKSADIQTKDSTIEFSGHHGALSSTFVKPFVSTNGNAVTPGSGYVGYYVPGKGMTEYTPEDRVEANKVTGSDSFASGTTTGWVVNDTTATMKATGITYQPKPGTREEDGKQYIEGVDILFMGAYEAGDPVDDVDVSLKVTKGCADAPAPADPTTSAPATSKPAEPQQLGSNDLSQQKEKHKGLLGVLGALGVLGIIAGIVAGLSHAGLIPPIKLPF